MQTFVPYTDFTKSAECLDRRRHNKQILEAKQIHNILLRKNTYGEKLGWANHPAIKMWDGYEAALLVYGMDMCAVYKQKYGVVHTCWHYFYDHITTEIKSLIEKPHWLLDESVIISHRSRLLFKGKLDIVEESLRKKFGRKFNEFLKANGFHRLTVFRQSEYDNLINFMKQNNIPLISGVNHYEQFNWGIPDNIEYVWPRGK